MVIELDKMCYKVYNLSCVSVEFSSLELYYEL